MTDHSSKPPEALLRAIAQDLKPVKPSPRPRQLALQMAGLAFVVSPLVILAIGVRPDAPQIGPVLTWVASAAQFAMAMTLVWIAARESTPARRLPRTVIHAALTTALMIVIVTTFLTFRISPENEGLRLSRLHALETVLPPNMTPWAMAAACAVGSTVMGGVLILIFSLVFRNSLANRPIVAGLLYGVGAGLAINASWRIACPISTPLHALGAHGVAIVATALLGALIGLLHEKEPRLPRHHGTVRMKT